jgi:hypothetical protein
MKQMFKLQFRKQKSLEHNPNNHIFEQNIIHAHFHKALFLFR